MTLEEYRKQIKEAQKIAEEADVTASNKLYDAQKKAVEDVYGKKIGDTAESYDDAYKKNETQRFVNSRALERRMAEMGLTDSGLNRTQQTALQLSYGNQNANITMQKQKAIDTLAAAMSSEVAGIESKKLAEAQNIRSAYDEAALTGAKELYKNEQDNLAKIEKERIAAEEKAKYIIQTNGGNLSRNFIGSLKDNGVSVRYNSNGTTTYTDNNSGKSSTFDSSINPYTGNNNETENSATAKAWNKYGSYDNGYQPRGVYNYGAFDKAVDTTPIYGRNQNIFVTTEKQGTHYWLWDGALNKYIEVFKNQDGKWEEKVG